MRVIQIPKCKGKFRTIYVPDSNEKWELKRLLPNIVKCMTMQSAAHVQHGFYPGRSPVTNAMQHKGYRYTLSFDLQDFFDTVTEESLALFAFDSRCFVDGAARQGLPTSPVIANIAANKMDEMILALAGRKGRFLNEFVYTRYADDLTFSFDDPRMVSMLKAQIPEIVAACGFKLNLRKTKVQCAVSGRRIVTGVGVDQETIHPTRYLRRKLRAALHRKNYSQANGLREQLKLKLPKQYEKPKPRKLIVAIQAEIEQTVHHLVANVRRWGKRKFDL